MNKFDKAFGGILLGFIIPITTLCILWWGSYLMGMQEIYVKKWAIAGIIIGIIIDIIFLGKLLSRFYHFNMYILIGLYIIYSIGIFGFFMGVPVFNVIPGVMAGIYVGRKMKITGQDPANFEEELRRANIFSSIVLLSICFCSAFLAITDPYTGAILQGMLNLSFKVTKTMIWFVVIFGGFTLLMVQHVLLLAAGRIAFEKGDW